MKQNLQVCTYCNTESGSGHVVRLAYSSMQCQVSFPDPNNPNADRLLRGSGGNADLWNVENSFIRDVISVKFYKKKN